MPLSAPLASPAAPAPLGAIGFARGLTARPIFRFLAVGCVGIVTDGSLFRLLVAGLGEPIARALSLGVATLVTWRLNRRFTFPPGSRQLSESCRYAAVALSAQGVSYTSFLALRALLPGLPDLLALLIGAVIATAFSFTGQRLFTFTQAGL